MNTTPVGLAAPRLPEGRLEVCGGNLSNAWCGWSVGWILGVRLIVSVLAAYASRRDLGSSVRNLLDNATNSVSVTSNHRASVEFEVSVSLNLGKWSSVPVP